jgi:hypothetical protein
MMTPKRLVRELDARLDGPHAAEHTTAAATLAAEAIRYLNYATGSHRDAGLEYPGDAYCVAASLSRALCCMPQALDQLGDWLRTQAAAGLLGTDDGTDPAEGVEQAYALLSAAGGYAAEAGRLLDATMNALATVNGRGPNREERAA